MLLKNFVCETGLVIFHLKALSGDLVLSLNQLKLF